MSDGSEIRKCFGACVSHAMEISDKDLQRKFVADILVRTIITNSGADRGLLPKNVAVHLLQLLVNICHHKQFKNRSAMFRELLAMEGRLVRLLRHILESSPPYVHSTLKGHVADSLVHNGWSRATVSAVEQLFGMRITSGAKRGQLRAAVPSFNSAAATVDGDMMGSVMIDSYCGGGGGGNTEARTLKKLKLDPDARHAPPSHADERSREAAAAKEEQEEVKETSIERLPREQYVPDTMSAFEVHYLKIYIPLQLHRISFSGNERSKSIFKKVDNFGRLIRLYVTISRGSGSSLLQDEKGNFIAGENDTISSCINTRHPIAFCQDIDRERQMAVYRVRLPLRFHGNVKVSLEAQSGHNVSWMVGETFAVTTDTDHHVTFYQGSFSEKGGIAITDAPFKRFEVIDAQLLEEGIISAEDDFYWDKKMHALNLDALRFSRRSIPTCPIITMFGRHVRRFNQIQDDANDSLKMPIRSVMEGEKEADLIKAEKAQVDEFVKRFLQ